MEDLKEKSNLQKLTDLIDQLHSGNFEAIQLHDDLSEDYQIVLNKLNDLGKRLNNKVAEGADSNKAFQVSSESEARYKTLVENVPFCIHEIDPDGKILTINSPGLTMLGLSKSSEVCGKSYMDFIKTDDRQKVQKLFREAFQGKESTFEFTFDPGEGIDPHIFKSTFIPIRKTPSGGVKDDAVTRVMGITRDITESVKTKQALQESRENLKIVVDSIDEVVYAFDFSGSHPNSGDITYLSPRVKKVLGYSVDEFRKDNELWFSILHPDDKESIVDKTRKLLEEKKTITRSYRLKHKKSKEYIWLEDKVTPQVNSRGEVTGLIGAARDITSRKNTEQALANSEEKYRTFFEKAPIGIGFTDRAGNILAFNNAIIKPGNYSRSDINKIKNVEELYYNKNERSRILKEFKSKGYVDQKEVCFKKKDGSPYYTALSLTPLTLDGKPYMMALVQDITASKETEEALIESEERNKTIVENVQEAIVLFESGEKQFIDFNKNAIQLFGYSEKELRNMTPADLSPEFQPDGRRSENAASQRISKALEGETQIFEWVHKDKNGREFPCEIHLTKIPYKDRFVVMGSVVDISERKKAENERENLIKELDRFVYSASHDLSAPLKSILGLLNVARLESRESQVGIYLDKMEQSINKLENFIKEIIQYSRNSRLAVNTEEIRLEELVNEILEDLKFSDGFSNIKFMLDFKEMPVIETDRFRLKVVLNNLLSNSIKFHRNNHDHQPFIKIRGFKDRDDKVINVIDNGNGIQKENLEKIFDMFYRGTPNSSGSGLGLYIAKEAAQNIDGTLSVDSTYGEGSTFSLRIPNN